jgi:SAM-dependent methyltransferase
VTDPIRDSYDAVAAEYDKQISGELAGKPLDRGLLAAFADLVPRDLPVGDVGCGPGHVAHHLAGLGCSMVGVDLSPAMIDIARRRYPKIAFQVGSMLDLPVADGAWGGAVAMYSIIHLGATERHTACRELARVIGPGGFVMVAFHIGDATHQPGDVIEEEEFLATPIKLTLYFLRPDDVAADLRAAGFIETARLLREPDPSAEYPSRRCYLIGRRAAADQAGETAAREPVA